MSYKPSKEDLLWAKEVNDKLVATQTYNPVEIKEAHKRLFGEEASNQHYARSRVFAYFQYTFKMEMLEDSVGTMENLHKQSHSEDDENTHPQKNDNGDTEEVKHKPKSRGRRKKKTE